MYVKQNFYDDYPNFCYGVDMLNTPATPIIATPPVSFDFSIYDTIPIGILIQDNNEKISYANALACTILDRTLDSVKGQLTNGLLGPVVDGHSLPVTDQNHPMLQCLRTGNPVVGAYLGFLHTDQKMHWLLINCQPRISKSTHAVEAVIATIIDVTEEKQIQDQLRLRTEELASAKGKEVRERARYEALLESMGDGVVATDWEGRVIIMNKQAEMIMGSTAQESMGKYWFEIAQLQDGQNLPVSIEKQPIKLSLQTGTKVSGNVYSFVRRDATKVPVSLTASPVVLYGRTVGVVATFRDITKEREVDQMKTEFIALASHQLRTPLSAIRWYSELLLSGDGGELVNEQKEFVQNIQEVNMRMIQLVNALLNISRIESGRIIIEPEPTDLNQLVKEVLEIFKVKTTTKKMQLTVSVNDHLPKINVDPKLIREVYVNLLSNAIKYTPSGGEITVVISKEGENIISQISDTGYGIPPKDKDKVFQKFYRGENIAHVETEGTGLGLYLVKRIVESSGGSIRYESEEGKGTSFWFTLPLKGSIAKKGEVSLSNSVT